jgi:asparagine synthase (glutamine-hydrolysing)
MCGIGGILNLDPGKRINISNLNLISEKISNRGPDDSGIWINNNNQIGLVHRRLSILDLSNNGAQPMKDYDNSNIIVFNGEIYNYLELRKGLIKKGYKFRSNSDTEVLLKLYSCYGYKMTEKLRGMFSFSIWDEDRNSMFLSRDHFGIKPLYFYFKNNTFIFASQSKAISSIKGLNLTKDPAGYVGFYLTGSVPEPFTLFKEIKSIKAGHNVIISSNGIKEFKYFDLSKEIRLAEENSNKIFNPDSFKDKLNHLIEDSVENHLLSDVPVGIFLSSGIDSSVIAHKANSIFNSRNFKANWKVNNLNNLKTLTLGFNEFQNTTKDETKLALRIANKIKSIHSNEFIDKNTFEDHYENIFKNMDLPSVDGINTYFTALCAKKLNLKVVLSGLGADELFMGYKDFKNIESLVRYLGPFGRLLNSGKYFRIITHNTIKKFTHPKYASIFEYSTDYSKAFMLKRGLYMPWELPELLGAEFFIEGWEKLQYLQSLSLAENEIKESKLKILVMHSLFYMKNQLLRDSDWSSMAHSIELRLPFVDINFFRGMLDFFSNKFYPTKNHLFETSMDYLPHEVADRKKTGFSTPVYEWTENKYNKKNFSRNWAKEVINNF